MVCFYHVSTILMGGFVMKTVKLFFLSIVVVFGIVGMATAADVASAAKGKALFNDTKLGTNGKTCNTCHTNGKGLEQAGSHNDLESIINGCITMPLQGKALDPKSADMQSLVLYVKSFSVK